MYLLKEILLASSVYGRDAVMGNLDLRAFPTCLRIVFQDMNERRSRSSNLCMCVLDWLFHLRYKSRTTR